MRLKLMALGMIILAGGSSLARAQVASRDALRGLNTALQQVLAPWNDSARKADLKFQAIELAPLNVKLSGKFALLEDASHFEFKLGSLHYRGPATRDAEVSARGEVSLDWMYVLGGLDHWSTRVEERLKQSLEDSLAQYGKAASVTLALSNVVQGRGKQIQSFDLEAQFQIDLSKVKSSLLREGVLFRKAKLSAHVRRDGLEFAFRGGLNPGYSDSRDASARLQEFLKQLLNLDVASLQHLVDVVRAFDAWVQERIVRGK